MNFLLQPQLGLSKGTKTACTLLLVAQFVTGASFMEQAQAATAPSTHTVKRANFAQTITGSVKDSDGSALAGASIQIKGGKGGATTNAEGNFKLDLPTGNETLIISMIGYKTKEVSVSGRSVVNIVLEDNTAAIDEVIVVGYAEQKKIHLTGAVAKIDMKAIEDLSVTNLSAALVGQVAGVGVSGGFSRPGSPASITVRNPVVYSKDGGAIDGTATSGTDPLYVIDGVIRTLNDFNILDASEVQDISILKDGSAAIYGSRGANGVIVVTTKKGNAGAPKFNYSASYGENDAYSHTKMMNALQLATYLNDYNYKTSTPTTTLYSQDELDYFKDNSYNWLDMAWKKSMQMRQTMNISGGTDRANYFAGVTYNKQDGNFENINFEKWNFRASADIKVGNRIKVGMGLAADNSEDKKYLLKQGGSNEEREYQSLIRSTSMYAPYYGGLPVNLTANSASAQNFHFFEVNKSNNYVLNKNRGININTYLEYDVPLVKGLKARLNYNKNYENAWGKEYGTRYNLYSFVRTGNNKHLLTDVVDRTFSISNGERLYYNPSYSESYQLNGTLNYSQTFGNHSISALAGFEQSEFYTDGITSLLDGGLLPNSLDNAGYHIGTGTLSTGAKRGDINETEKESGRFAYIGRINYVFKNKYLAELLVRRDASANFTPENRWGTFPSLSVGWVMSEEPFFKKNVAWVDMLKLRMSAGLLGTDQTKAYQWLQSYELIQANAGAVFGGNSSKGAVTYIKNTIANPNLSWDSHQKYNFGIDATFLKNRMNFEFNAFLDHGYDLLAQFSSQVPFTVGAAVPSENYNATDGFGYEISLGWKGDIAKDWSYNIGGFLSWSDNRIRTQKLTKKEQGLITDLTGKSSDGGLMGYRTAGMFRTQEEVDAFLAQNKDYKIEGTTPTVGMLYYQDIRGEATYDTEGNFTGYGAPDGKITAVDMDYIADRASNHFGFGSNFSTRYKNLKLSFVVSGSFGGKELIESSARGWGSSADRNAQGNLPEHLADHWSERNPNGKYPGPLTQGQSTLNSDFWMIDSFNMAVRNANLSYELSKSMLNKLNISSARIFLTANNPLSIVSPYSYKTFSGAYDNYPVLRSYSLGVSLGF